MGDDQKQFLLERAEEALDDVRPHLAVDGGDIEIVELTDDLVLKIKWLGNCVNCSMSALTLKAGIEQSLKQRVPEIHSIEPINNLTELV